ncbi:hypothetical protein EV361DRAFT_873244 [Lentinula raphanica]|nr:hypothetical protein EV361DRAFT_873244 [Lentinula raphanica]
MKPEDELWFRSTLHHAVSSAVHPKVWVCSEPVKAEFRVIRQRPGDTNRLETKRVRPSERWQGKVGDYITYKQDKSKRVTLLFEHLAKGGELMGTVTFHSHKIMEESLRRLIAELEKMNGKFAHNVFLVVFGISFLAEDPGVLSVEMNRAWYVMLRDMFKVKGTGEGMEVPENDTVMRESYAKIEEELTKALDDLGFSLKDLAKKQLFNIGQEDMQ